ncbi:unnamed protein product [Cyprideis torosa]|uniref:E3 SUMO-protein ligase NSE2 n=1 Tax=Cyprideis torosa TaxID=163714 RepID=A0A7R8ZK63_9CRUS|nr:unnamed protein product [Cyprideis torosa]CAG0890092.1 unnamed protein product [Cyprideis torosa]
MDEDDKEIMDMVVQNVLQVGRHGIQRDEGITELQTQKLRDLMKEATKVRNLVTAMNSSFDVLKKYVESVDLDQEETKAVTIQQFVTEEDKKLRKLFKEKVDKQLSTTNQTARDESEELERVLSNVDYARAAGNSRSSAVVTLEDGSSESTGAVKKGKIVITSTVDAFSRKTITEPVRNPRCKHIYEEKIVRMYLRKKGPFKCYFAGCQNRSLISDLSELEKSEELSAAMRAAIAEKEADDE